MPDPDGVPRFPWLTALFQPPDSCAESGRTVIKQRQGPIQKWWSCSWTRTDLTLILCSRVLMVEHKFVSYLRVSTDRQGRSGLGLEAQHEAVLRYLDGGKWLLAAEYVETESGKRADRPKLATALAHAKAIGATVIFAKLDRLTRNVDLLRSLVASGVDLSGRTPTGQSSSAMPLRQAERFRSALVSDVNLFGNREGIVHFDTEISNGAFDLSVPKKL
jgi:hypothetical protein